MNVQIRHPELPDSELIAQINRTEAAFPDLTLPELFELAVQRQPASPALICDQDRLFGASSLSYGQLNAKANQLAYLLRAEGVGRDDVVGIMADRSFSMMIGILGILKSGAAYLPIPPDNPPDRTQFMLKDARVRILLSQGTLSAAVPFSGRVLNLQDCAGYQAPGGDLPVVNRPGDLAYVIYTSGSTGKPKGVMIEHRSLVNRLNWMQSAYPIGSDDVILQKTPFFFDVSVWELFWFALHGAKLCPLMPGGEKFPVAIVDAIRKHQVTVLHFVPSMLNVFLEYVAGRGERGVRDLRSVRQVFSSGEALSSAHLRKFNASFGCNGARLANLYGPTEATIDVTYFNCPAQVNLDSIPIGRPIDNTTISIIKDGRSAAIGEAGELCIGGVGLARGYLNNTELTQQKFVDNPINPGERIYRTGDIARWLPTGDIDYIGREDEQVKIRGLRIELGEIEATIRTYAGVSDCVVVAREYAANIIPIVAYVVCGGQVEFESLKRHLKRTLPQYMVPSHFLRIEQIPLTVTGKADRKALPDPLPFARHREPPP